MAVTPAGDPPVDRPRFLLDPGEGRFGSTRTGITTLTTASPLRDDVRPDDVSTLLERLPVGDRSPFAASRRTHFARLQVIDGVTTRRRRRLQPAVLVLSADFDGAESDWLVEILNGARTLLGPVIGRCRGAPTDPSAPRFVPDGVGYLLRHAVPNGLQYVTSEHRTAVEVDEAVTRARRFAGFALGHRHATPAELRADFLTAFGPAPAAAGKSARS